MPKTCKKLNIVREKIKKYGVKQQRENFHNKGNDRKIILKYCYGRTFIIELLLIYNI